MRLHSIRQRLSLVVGYDMVVLWRDNVIIYYYIDMYHEIKCNCGIRHVTVPIATRILIANVRHIGLSNICVINLVYFKMQV